MATGIIQQAKDAGMKFSDYGDQQVRTDDTYMQQLAAGAKNMNMTPQEYDKFLNPTTYGARWGVSSSSTPSSGISPSAINRNGIINQQRANLGTPSLYDASVQQMDNGSYGYQTAQLKDPVKWNVDKNQTVSGQLEDILKDGSPLLDQAETSARQRANASGLLNSSMAVTAGQDALYRTALPIATADAATYNKAAGYNTDEANQFSLQNANMQNQAAGFNASSANKKDSDLLSADTSIKTANIGAEASKANAFTSANASTRNAEIGADASKYNANLSAETQKALAGLDSNTRNLVQSNSTAANSFQTFMNVVANIRASTTMDEKAKATAIADAENKFNQQLQVISAIGGVDLSKFFVQAQPSPLAPPTEPAAEAPPPPITNPYVSDPFDGGE